MSPPTLEQVAPVNAPMDIDVANAAAPKTEPSEIFQKFSLKGKVAVVTGYAFSVLLNIQMDVY